MRLLATKKRYEQLHPEHVLDREYHAPTEAGESEVYQAPPAFDSDVR